MPERVTVMDRGSGWQRWQIYFALLTLLATLLTAVYSAGSMSARYDLRISKLEDEVQQIHMEYERKDVVEERLANIELDISRIASAEEKQADMLQQVLVGGRNR